jgi:type III pantothenate kinase
MKLVIDFGNTFVKLAVFSSNMVLKQYQFKHLTIQNLKEIAQKHAEIRSVIISSVVNYSDELKSFLKEKYHFYELDSETPLPIKNKYKSPETLGKDRIAAVVAASHLYPNKNVLVIDAGSCITFDFINDQSEYHGGSITSGFQMRLKSVHEFTANLPLLEAKKIDYLIGSTTEESILSGVYNGLISEIDGIIGAYKGIYEKLTVILSGGDHIYFDKRLKNNIFALPNIVMIGLNIILEFNENKK